MYWHWSIPIRLLPPSTLQDTWGKDNGQKIKTLEDNNWITDCDGGWGSMILLAPKPYQEDINNIDDFVWRLCVSYRGLNSVTKTFFSSFRFEQTHLSEDRLVSGGDGIHTITTGWSNETITATKLLSKTGAFLFDLLPSSPRFRAVTYNSRSNKPYERSYHSL